MAEMLTLNDGTVLENASALLSRDLFLYVNGSDLRTVFDLLIEPENTLRIVYTQVNGEEKTFAGYEKLIAVRDEGNNLITAVLRRGVVD